MFKNYLITGWRNLLRNRTFSIINFTGLSISIAFCLLLFYHIRNEQSFDGFHAKKDRLFRLESTSLFGRAGVVPKKGGFFSFLSKQDDDKPAIGFPLVVSGDMQAALPEVKSITRLKDYGENLVKVGNQVYREKHLFYADDNFLQNFSFRLKKGDPASALKSIHHVILSESVAKKCFGDQDPIGKTVTKIGDSVQMF